MEQHTGHLDVRYLNNLWAREFDEEADDDVDENYEAVVSVLDSCPLGDVDNQATGMLWLEQKNTKRKRMNLGTRCGKAVHNLLTTKQRMGLMHNVMDNWADSDEVFGECLEFFGKRHKNDANPSQTTAWRRMRDMWAAVRALSLKVEVTLADQTTVQEPDLRKLRETVANMTTKYMGATYALMMDVEQYKKAVDDKKVADTMGFLLTSATKANMNTMHGLGKQLDVKITQHKVNDRVARAVAKEAFSGMFQGAHAPHLGQAGGGQPVACSPVQPMLDAAMKLLEESGLGVKQVVSKDVVIVLRPRDDELGGVPEDQKDMARKLRALDRTATAEQLVDALGWPLEYVSAVYPRAGDDDAGWRIRLKTAGKVAHAASRLVVENLVLPKHLWEMHGHGYDMPMSSSKIVVEGMPYVHGQVPSVDAVRQHTGWAAQPPPHEAYVIGTTYTATINTNDISEGEATVIYTTASGVGVAENSYQWKGISPSSIDGKTFAVDGPGVTIGGACIADSSGTNGDDPFAFLADGDVEYVEQAPDGLVTVRLKPGRGPKLKALVAASPKAFFLYKLTLTKGWDAFPAKQKDGVFGATIAAAMTHLGIKGMPRGVANTWVHCLIQGDDGAIEYVISAFSLSYLALSFSLSLSLSFSLSFRVFPSWFFFSSLSSFLLAFTHFGPLAVGIVPATRSATSTSNTGTSASTPRPTT